VCWCIKFSDAREYEVAGTESNKLALIRY
jgi:hypothetical protein